MKRIVVTTRVFAQILDRLAIGSMHSTDWPVSESRCGDVRELVVAPASSVTKHRLRVVLTDSFVRPTRLPATIAGALIIGKQRRLGQTIAYVKNENGQCEPADEVKFIGPGMHKVDLLAKSRQMEGALGGETSRWSRSKGALGDAWGRLIGLHIAVIGTGRAGSVMARGLLRIGVRRLTLVDPDLVEIANLGESDDALTMESVGQAKVSALSEQLLQLYPDASIRCVEESITCVQALHSVKGADVIVCTSDHDSARMAATCAASLYCRPLIDVGTGITQGEPPRMGATVRLTLPGRCLLCTGGLDVGDVRNVLQSRGSESSFHKQRDWQAERRGSLASLNHLAVALAQRMIEDLVAEKIDDSMWAQLEYDEHGKMDVIYPPLHRNLATSTCKLCESLTGRADNGVGEVAGVVHERLEPRSFVSSVFVIPDA